MILRIKAFLFHLYHKRCIICGAKETIFTEKSEGYDAMRKAIRHTTQTINGLGITFNGIKGYSAFREYPFEDRCFGVFKWVCEQHGHHKTQFRLLKQALNIKNKDDKLARLKLACFEKAKRNQLGN